MTETPGKIPIPKNAAGCFALIAAAAILLVILGYLGGVGNFLGREECGVGEEWSVEEGACVVDEDAYAQFASPTPFPTAASEPTPTLAAPTVPPVTVAPAATGTNPFTNATISFAGQSGVVESSTIEGGGPGGVWTTNMCWPPAGGQFPQGTTGTFGVSPSGELTGDCSFSQADQWVGESTLSGFYDVELQTVEFHMEGVTVYTPKVGGSTITRTTVVDGPIEGGQVIGNVAEGLARFRHVFNCEPDETCGDPKTFTVTGTVQFGILFGPPVATP